MRSVGSAALVAFAAACIGLPCFPGYAEALEHGRLPIKGDYEFRLDAAPETGPLLTLSQHGKHIFHIAPEGGLNTTRLGLLFVKHPPRNGLRSRWLYMPPAIRGPSNEPLLFVFGWAYASDPGSLYVLSLPATGSPKMLMADGAFSLNSFSRQKDKPVLVGQRSFGEASGPCTGTYDPESVFLIGRDGRFAYSTSASRIQNLKDGYPWAGPKPREDVLVDRCAHKARLIRNAESYSAGASATSSSPEKRSPNEVR